MADTPKEESFLDIVTDIGHGPSLMTDDEDQDGSETPSGEESPAEDKATEILEDEDRQEPEGEEPEDREVEDDGDEDDDEAQTEGDDEASEDEDDEDSSETVIVDGKEIPIDQVREWRDGAMRQADYTRKTQELAEERRRLEGVTKARDELISDIVSSQPMNEFLGAHPEVLEHLLQDPEATRELIKNPQKIKSFWEDYELILERPHLAGKLAGEEREDAQEEVSEELQAERTWKATLDVMAGLKGAVEQVGQEYKGVDTEQVEDWLLRLGGLDPDNAQEATPQQIVGAAQTLYQTLFRQTRNGLMIDPTLIRDRFEIYKGRTTKKKDEEKKAAEEHNRKVDEALESQAEKSPPVSKGGKAPTASPKEVEMPDDFRGALDDLLYGSLNE